MRKIIASIILTAFISTSVKSPALAFTGNELSLPKPGSMVALSQSFNPPLLRGIKVFTNNPLNFDFILDPGGNPLKNLKQQTTQMIKYFLTTLTIPDDDIWVNLSPYEKDRIITEKFGQTQMGRDLLAQDYLLKQITASLMFPQGETGKKFWKRIYEEASKRFGTTQVAINTFNKVWIMPDKAVIYEKMGNNQATAFVIESSLKVMLEEDYLALKKNQRQPGDMSRRDVSPSTLPNEAALNVKATQGTKGYGARDTSTLSSQIVREVMIPILQKEVNTGANFAPLRQVYNSILLALWYKERMQGSILQSAYVNHNKIAGVDVRDKQAAQKIWRMYVRAYRKGVVNLIKEEQDPATHEVMPKKYFAGGFNIEGLKPTVTHNFAMLGRLLKIGALSGFLLAGCKVEPAYYLPSRPLAHDTGSSQNIDAGVPVDSGLSADAGIAQGIDVGVPSIDSGLPENAGIPDVGVSDTGALLPDAQLADTGLPPVLPPVSFSTSLSNATTPESILSTSLNVNPNGEVVWTVTDSDRYSPTTNLIYWFTFDPTTGNITFVDFNSHSTTASVSTLEGQALLLAMAHDMENNLARYRDPTWIGQHNLLPTDIAEWLQLISSFLERIPTNTRIQDVLLGNPHIFDVVIRIQNYIVYIDNDNQLFVQIGPKIYNLNSIGDPAGVGGGGNVIDVVTNDNDSADLKGTPDGQADLVAVLMALEAVLAQEPPGSPAPIISDIQSSIDTVKQQYIFNGGNPSAVGVDAGFGNGDHAMVTKKDRAMRHNKTQVLHSTAQLNKAPDVFTKGGIDLTKNSTPLNVRNSGRAVHFNIDPAQIVRLKEARGLVPKVFSINRLQSLPEFLGMSPQEAQRIRI